MNKNLTAPEQWDAYTRDGELAGAILIRGEKIPAGLYHMVCEVLVRHADGSVLCMKRAESKPNFPGFYEATAGGSALQGEDPFTCIKRELCEETGLVCDAFREIGCYADEKTQTIYYSYVCTVECDKNTVVLQEGETEAFVWMTETEFISFLRSDRIIEQQRRRFLSYYKEMNWFRYKLLALDMDGTLLDSKGELPDGNVTAVKQAAENGIMVTISTGRHIQGARECVKALGIRAPIITYNGAVILNPVTEETLFSQDLSEKDALTVMEHGIRLGATMCIWSNGRLYGLPLNERVHAYKKLSGIEPLPAEELRVLAKKGVTKVVWYDDADRIETFRKELKPSDFESVNVCTSHPMFLEFIHRDGSKGAALKKIGRMFGIERAEMIAVGDGENDLEMLAYAGLGVAMGNASDIVKSKADTVTATNDECGVAEVIRRYLL